jgi:hypothetical protein
MGSSADRCRAWFLAFAISERGIRSEWLSDSLCPILNRLDYVWKRPRYVLAADEQREKKRHIRRVVGCLPQRSVVLAEDETDLLLFPPLRAM